MKISAAFLALATVATASAKNISANTARKLVRSSRRLDEEAEEEDEEAFLYNYNVKVIGCKRDLATPIVNEDGEYEYAAVLVRLCPSSNGCDSDLTEGCNSGYGDLLVGVQTFVEAYMEDIEEEQDDGNGDDNFELDKYAKCEEYNPDDNADDGNQGAWENYAFYVGPTCSDDGLSIKLDLFTDEYCSQASEVTFDTISNGWALPYSDGGLVSTNCQSCTEYNDDGEMELKEVCKKTYEDAATKCEEDMAYPSYYGANTQGCETIAEMFPAKSSNAGAVFGWIVLAVAVVGLGGYVMWWRKRKATSIE